ncbi:unnamed protein product [Vitrella brassicaformis CCMP3155]|uniref:ATP-dependent DNA helicase n=1 Tax=Vitrella brassicaformis (strain CCMP3155) TaxID=1169540 RepID=A0A0G4EGW1_VITBC|nr:unnamed protein product [Vitrella brassicaformis CCMP3155]|eukprot:CEL95482.1 unnamed protein product [Vitrella brassicaformis CCMP3155]
MLLGDRCRTPCKLGAPWPLCNETHWNVHGRCIYRRRDVLDRWIASYSPVLLALLRCHVYCDVVAFMKVIIYMFRYMWKPHKNPFTIKWATDSASTAARGHSFKQERDEQRARQSSYVERLAGADSAATSASGGAHGGAAPARDEIAEYQEGRVICGSEACHRILSHRITVIEPPVITLPVVLPEKRKLVQLVYGRQSERGRVIQPKPNELEHWLARPDDPEFDDVTYQQFFERYQMKQQRQAVPKGRRSFRTKNGDVFYERASGHKVCTRLQTMNVSQGEPYYLRLLLKTSKARGSYEALRTINGQVYDHYVDAARESGLLQGDEFVKTLLLEAIEDHGLLPFQLRLLFVQLIVNHECDAPEILETHRDFLVSDYEEDEGLDPNAAYQLLLRDISEDIDAMSPGKTNKDFSLPEPEDFADEGMERQSYGNLADVRREHDRLFSLFETDPEQLRVYNDVLEHLYPDASRANETVDGVIPMSVIVPALAGSGKTTLLQCLLSAVRMRGNIAIATATTALAALNYTGGHTAHGALKIKVVDNISKEPVECTDEVTMAHVNNIEATHRMLQDITGIDRPFGGKVFVCAGDFRQLTPVLPRGEDSNEINAWKASIKSSVLWPCFERYELLTNHRIVDQAYSDLCLKVGDGLIPTFHIDPTADETLLAEDAEASALLRWSSQRTARS